VQELYGPSVPVSLAKIYIKPDGDGVEYIPFSIYYETQLVGFSSERCSAPAGLTPQMLEASKRL